MNVCGYELIGEWKVSNVGFTALATRGGKKYFLKRYGEYKMPRRNASTSDKLFARLEREFKEFMENRIAINEALSSVACEGGNIILPTKWFVDDINFIEATEFVNNLIEDEDIMKLPADQLHFVMMTAAKAMKEIHGKNIIHSDLKRTNILAAKNPSGKIVAKVIDFDKSYFVGKVRENDLGGDQLYMSPELTWCLMCECEEDAVAALTQKSDIFSLGVVFYNYLTKGEFPKISGLSGGLKKRADEGKTVYCGEALVSEATLTITKKIKEPYLACLIANMLYREPEKRPSAQEVLDVLKTKRVLPVDESQGIKIEGGTPSATPAPSASTVPTSASTVSRPTSTPRPAPAPAPAPTPSIPSGFCAPWGDHGITFVEDKIRANGYVACEQYENKGIKCYRFYKADGTRNTFTLNNLKMLGWISGGGATSTASTSSYTRPTAPTPPPTPAPTPSSEVWDKDSAYTLLVDKIKSSGYTGIGKMEKNGRQGYGLIKADGSSTFVLINQLVVLGFAKRK